MSVDFASALVGFSGAVLGSAVTAYVARHQQEQDAALERERRRDDAERERVARQEARDAALAEEERRARIAARVLQGESLQARNRIRATLRSGRYWSEPFALPHASWAEFREHLAGHLPLADWVAVSDWYRSATSLEAQVQSRRSVTQERRPVPTDKGRSQLALGRKRADRAISALEKFTQDRVEGAGSDDDLDEGDQG